MLCASRDHEIVVVHPPKLRSNKPFFSIDTKNVFHQYCGVALGAQYVPDRPRNIRRRKGSGSDLIEQRLKAMVIVPVDNHDFCSGVPKCFGGFEPAKTRANNHHPDPTVRHSVSPSWRKSQSASLVAK